jgi:hypothetical protein
VRVVFESINWQRGVGVTHSCTASSTMNGGNSKPAKTDSRPWLFVLQTWVDKGKLNIPLLTYYVIDVI